MGLSNVRKIHRIGDQVVLYNGRGGVIEDTDAAFRNYLVRVEGNAGLGWYNYTALLSSGGSPGADPVQSPAHYDLPGGIQVIDLIRGESFLRGNIIKYVMRAPHKGNELEDMEKAAEYLKWELERLRALG